MEWIGELQQMLGRPVLAFAREYWVFLLAGLTIAAAGFFGSARDDSAGFDLNDSDGGGGDGGD
jgi:hypothetical protein